MFDEDWYRPKKPVFQALQWTVDNYQDVIAFTNSQVALSADGQTLILFSSGSMVMVPNTNWIMKFEGQDHSGGPIVTRYSVTANTEFQENYEVTEAPASTLEAGAQSV